MQLPPGVNTPPDYVCHLRRALYGLKQAPRAWFERFTSVITAAGFYLVITTLPYSFIILHMVVLCFFCMLMIC
jgi:hypothetical protein